MNIEYQLNQASAAFNGIYFDSPRVEILCGSTFGSLCCIKHRKFEFDIFFMFFPNFYFGGRDTLPHAFLKHLMGEKCDKVILQSPLGKSWHVKVCGGKEDMWFGDGWFDFFQGHDLQVGECLVFRYDG